MIRAIALALLGLVVVSLAGCDPSSWNPVNNGKDVPKSHGPCGSWPDCGPDQPKAERCCIPTTKCWVEADGERSCVADAGYDPVDPVTWGAAKMAKYGARHFKRSARGQ